MFDYVNDFTQMGYGMAIHWGLYSQMSQAEWCMSAQNISVEEYEKLADTFTAKDFDPKFIAKQAKAAGMKFIILTTRHHDGYSLYDTKGLNKYDAVNTAPGRDLIKEFVDACNEEGISPFFYHTTMDWWWEGESTSKIDEGKFEKYLDYLSRSVEILCANYGKIGGFIFDGNWCRSDLDWKDSQLYQMIKSYQPEAIIMNNTGLKDLGRVSAPEIDAVCFEQHAVHKIEQGERPIASMRWQTVNDHWGDAMDDLNYKSIPKLLEDMVHTRKHGAVHILNIGLESQGAISIEDQAILHSISKWMEYYSEAFYNGRPCECKCSNNDFLLTDGETGYYFAYEVGIDSPSNVGTDIRKGKINSVLNIDKKVKTIEWMDNQEEIQFIQDIDKKILSFKATPFLYGRNLHIRVAKLTF